MPPAIAHTFAGMVLDGSGDLIMCDREHTQVDVFPPGKTTASRVISNGLKGCGVMAFDSTYSTLYVANQPDVEDGPGFPGVVSAFDYATGTKDTTSQRASIPRLRSSAISPSTRPRRSASRTTSRRGKTSV